ncbi:hypothetical protein HDV03_003253 [Kappamyces sp. JEL0829]|nr:hypothetical protein HDV03_003253 [Kappamyces sp. JEL0829]
MQAQNKYYPPDYDPKEFRTINDYSKYQRNPKASRLKPQVEAEDILEELRSEKKPGTTFRTITVRFEMPFNIWCLGCNNHIGMGVRYNAEKKHTGNYHSTPIFTFRMKCHLCPSFIVIQTDPKNAEYVILEGARKRIETFDPTDAGVLVLAEEDEKEKLEEDVFYRLEHGLADQSKAAVAAPEIDDIVAYNDAKWKDPYTKSQMIRRKFRSDKKQEKAIEKASLAVQDRLGLSIPVLPPSHEDEDQARLVEFEYKERSLDPSAKPQSEAPIFSKSRKKPSTTAAHPVKKKSLDSKQKLLKLVAATRTGNPFGGW